MVGHAGVRVPPPGAPGALAQTWGPLGRAIGSREGHSEHVAWSCANTRWEASRQPGAPGLASVTPRCAVWVLLQRHLGPESVPLSIRCQAAFPEVFRNQRPTLGLPTPWGAKTAE